MNYTGRFALVTVQGPTHDASAASAWHARERAVLARVSRIHVASREQHATTAARRRLGQPMRRREGQRAAGAAAGAVAAGAVAFQPAAARLSALGSRAPQARQHADAAQRRCRSDELQGEDAPVCADG